MKSVLGPRLKDELYRELEKRKYNKIINKVKRLKRLKNTPLANKENISEKELYELSTLTKLPTQSLKKLAQLRGVETTGLKRHELLTNLMGTEKHHREQKYLKHLQSDSVSQIDTLINLIRTDIIKLDRLLDKSDRKKIKKRLYETETLKRTHKKKKILIDELIKIYNSLCYIKDHSAFDSSGYYGLKDLEYMFNDIENYYYPILTKQSFNGNYQMYTCRGDKDNTMSIYDYISKISPYLLDLIVKKTEHDSNKIQLVIAIDLIHLTSNNIVTFCVKSKNVICTPADNRSDILHELVSSLLKYYNEKLLLCRIAVMFFTALRNLVSIFIH